MKLFFFSFFLIVATAFGAPKIYDCFMFCNELGILEIRLNELDPVVDKFVIVESLETHRTGSFKPYYFDLNQDRFAQFKDKIIHIKLEKQEGATDGWSRENWQRNQIMQGLKNCQPDDIIIISDVDEIIPRSSIPFLDKILHPFCTIVGFKQKMYRWFINRFTGELWAGSGAIRCKDLQKISPQRVRYLTRTESVALFPVGWHFTSMGGYDLFLEKLKDIVEGNDRPFSYQTFRDFANRFPLVPIDSTFPKFVQDNISYLIDQNLIDREIN